MLFRMAEIIRDLCKKWNCELIEFNGESDHVHLLFRYYPQLQLSKFVNSLKTVTSRLIRKDFISELPQSYERRHVFWNESYFIASCGGVTVEVLKKYVQQQKTISIKSSSVGFHEAAMGEPASPISAAIPDSNPKGMERGFPPT
jgi:putative transposase